MKLEYRTGQRIFFGNGVRDMACFLGCSFPGFVEVRIVVSRSQTTCVLLNITQHRVQKTDFVFIVLQGSGRVKGGCSTEALQDGKPL